MYVFIQFFLKFSIFQSRNCRFDEDAFARRDVPMNRDNMCYLGITDGPQDCLVVTWSQTDLNHNRWLTIVLALHNMVGHESRPLFRIAIDPVRRFGFILCLDNETAEAIHARYVQVGHKRIFFDLVRSVRYLPYLADVNQHIRVVWRV